MDASNSRPKVLPPAPSPEQSPNYRLDTAGTENRPRNLAQDRLITETGRFGTFQAPISQRTSQELNDALEVLSNHFSGGDQESPSLYDISSTTIGVYVFLHYNLC